MKALTGLALLFCLLFLNAGTAEAAAGWCAAPRTATAPLASQHQPDVLKMTDTLNVATGAAINPLLVVGGLGAWCWLDTPQPQRARLPWHQQPWYWGPLLAIALLYLFGSLTAIFAPGSNKFTEAARTLEGNLQPLYTLPFLLPFVYQRFGGGSELPEKLLTWIVPAAHAAGHDSPTGISFLPLLLALAFACIYGVVWLTTQAVNAAVLISPFPWLDLLIRTAHLGYVALLIALSILSPFLGLLLTLPLVILALLVCGWCFRLSVFGTIVASDLLLFWRKIVPGKTVLAFAAHRFEDVPVRTCGKVQPTETGLVFQYRPWLILPKRRLPLKKDSLVLERGLLYPRLRSQEQERIISRLILPPRYCRQEEAVAQELGIATIRNSAVLQGIAAIRNWGSSLFRAEA